MVSEKMVLFTKHRIVYFHKVSIRYLQMVSIVEDFKSFFYINI